MGLTAVVCLPRQPSGLIPQASRKLTPEIRVQQREALLHILPSGAYPASYRFKSPILLLHPPPKRLSHILPVTSHIESSIQTDTKLHNPLRYHWPTIYTPPASAKVVRLRSDMIKTHPIMELSR